MTLLRRIAAEKRSLVLPLALAILVNIGVYALVVYPLGVKSAGAADRALAATNAVRAADRDYANARALVTGKSRAEQELATFYQKVLPPDQSSARRLTYASLPALAKKTNVKYLQSRYEPDPQQEKQRFGRLHIRMVLQGEYENLRQFIYEVESAPEFVIIDDVTLTQGEPGKPLTLALELSTYYRLGANGD